MLSVQEVAARLGVSPRRVLAIIKSGRLKARKIGREWIIEAASLEAFAKEARSAGRPKKDAASWSRVPAIDPRRLQADLDRVVDPRV